ncbi:type I restriction modification DNA specificity domain protein [Candidatus Nitrosoglobus terrae]|uniref:Type I restriction modification DNA specificity domain protein n=1 Tax=Candidatus Nitrosoglobus terrae TaxID=1630141 RepID=A0A1Q2SPK2_9GAMM|nr:restriction endonuclease subunit S [Candidatus Nitrosoglobus terrae]BAW81064.1 type I restriction modification DNA specificity domain protein [Candidatus Nitrosoglobus terrae]
MGGNILELIKQNPVEWKPLGDALIRTRGTKITAGQMKELHKDNAPLKIFAGGRTYALVDFQDIPAKDINLNPSIIVKSRGVIEFEYCDQPFSHKNEMWSYYSDNESVNIKYIYYYLKTQETYFQNLGTRMQMPQIATPDTDKFTVPIPPLDIQAEIVRILDAFTAMTAELTAELNIRQQQYNYYRDLLLSEAELQKVGFEWKTLREVGELVRGNGLPKADFTESGIPAIHYGQIYTYYGLSTVETLSFTSLETAEKLRKVDTGDVIITNTSENLEDVSKALVYLGEQQAVTGGHATIFKPSNAILNKFFAYYTQTNFFFTEKRKYAKGTKVIDVSATDLAKIKVPIPPLTEQARIVAILDKFDTLTSSISEGLPREIKLRQQQYEYYRDLLLSFSKTEVDTLSKFKIN